MNECFPVPKSADDGVVEWFVLAETPEEALAIAVDRSGQQTGTYAVSDPLDLEGAIILEGEVR
jgi:hypothetical protein